jgi:CheY-like chemotaxis protein
MKPPVGPQDGLAAQRFALLEAIPGASTASAVVSAVDAALSFPKTPSEAQPSPSAAPKAWRRAASDGSDAAEPAFAALPRPLLKALVVDGDAEYRCFLRGLLEAHGFEVNHAANGSDGIEVALARRPWLILTDVDIPGMDGFEFCRRVRSHGLLEHTPLVFLSAWDDYGERYHGLRLGANDYVSKRMPTRELLIRLQLVLKRYADVRTTRGTGMAGEIELVGAPGLLQMCHLGRLTGLCTVRAGMVRIQIRFREGQVLGAASSRARGADAVYELLSWSSGQFEFQPCDPGDGQPLTESFDYLLLEGCRRLDDERRQTAIGSSGAPPPEESDTRSARPRGVGLH